MKRLSGKALDEHLKYLSSMHFTDIVKDVFTKIMNGKEKEITYTEVKFILDKLNQ